jgi:hypothetical protein
MYPVVGLLDHMVFLFLILVGTSTLFSIMCVLVYTLTNSVQLVFSLSVVALFISYFFIIAILSGKKKLKEGWEIFCYEKITNF